MQVPPPEKEETTVLPFLRVSHIGPVGKRETLTLTGDVRLVTGNFNRQLLCAVLLHEEAFIWPVTINTPNHRYLFSRFGEDTENWKGTVLVEVKQPTRAGFKPYIAVVPS